MDRQKEVDREMNRVSPSWQRYWCESKMCACLGCVNNSGSARITKEEWQDWMNRNKKEVGHDIPEWQSYTPKD